MKELVVISGKGGTGKTSLTASLVVLSDRCVVIDCDVDAPDLHLLIEPHTIAQQPFVGGRKAYIRESACQGCGRCRQLCRFGAIHLKNDVVQMVTAGFAVDPLACEGCGVCVDHCPQEAIELRPQINGRWYVSRCKRGYLFHASLDVGSENSGKLVTHLRRSASEFARKEGLTLLLTDGPPGIGCPVIASLTGASLALIVTEPTVSGLHDFERVLHLCLQLGVPALTVVNKADLNLQMVERIAQSSVRCGAKFLGTIPFDPDVVRAEIAGRSVVEVSDGPASRSVKAIYSAIMERLAQSLDAHQSELVSINVKQGSPN